MAKRMDGTETWFRVRYEVEYDITYRQFNRDWDYQKPTTGDYEGDNPMYTQDDEETHENFYTYLGPFNSKATLEREAKKFEDYYRSETFRNCTVTRGVTEKAQWVEI